MSKTTSQDIKATLWKAAGTFRGTIDAANYKDFVLSMLFLKYLNDTYKEHVKELEERYNGMKFVSSVQKEICRLFLEKKKASTIFMSIASILK